MAVTEITTGDDENLVADLTVDRHDGNGPVPFIIPPTATVTAMLKERAVALTSEVTCLSTTPGADWAISKVVAPFSKEVTRAIPVCGDRRSATLEIQIVDGTTSTFHGGEVVILSDQIK